jgi:CubicO group peptidase (beta-lactamase class C family)
MILHPQTLVRAALAAVTASALTLAACSQEQLSGDPEPSPSTANEPSPSPLDVDEAIAELAESGFSGTVLVADGGEVTARGIGFADREATVPNGPDVVYDIGSLTKQFTGAAVLRLQMEGRLSVDDTVAQYFGTLPPEVGAITIHQLLTHTAGLVDAFGDDYEPLDRQAFLDRLATTPLAGAPGGEYRYSNVGYALLAAIIEEAAGMGYEQYLNQALFTPAGMEATGYVLPDWDAHVVAIGYADDRALGRPNEQPWSETGPYWNLLGNGGLLSTPNDMFRWHEALLGDDILDAEAKQLYYGRHTPEGPGSETYYGYGWALFPTSFDTWLVTHNGGNDIFFADFLRFLDEEVTVFLASNAARQRDELAAFELAEAALGQPVVET